MQKSSLKAEDDSATNHLSYELRDTFYSSSRKGNLFHVSLNSNGLLLQRDKSTGEHKDELVSITDIIGGRCVWFPNSVRLGAVSTCGACTPTITEKENIRGEDAYLYVFAYVLKKSKHVIRRERTVVTLRFRSYDNQEDNMREAQKWYRSLISHRTNYLLFCNIQGAEPCEKMQKSLKPKRLLILLNPRSGSGKARDIFNQQVVNILNESEAAYDLHVTKHSNYASNFVHQTNLSIWSGIVAIGGDGLFHEILNGLLKRKDRNSVVNNITLGIVPCGSGNGLARSIAHYFHEPYESKPTLGAALSLVGSQSALMDVVEIEQHNKVTYSFLSVGWGLISDIDIESECLRLLGYRRFTIWTVHRLINLRTYRGKISYLLKKISEQQNTPETFNKTYLNHSMSSTFPQRYELKKHTISNISNTEFEDVISLETVATQSYRSRCNSLLSSDSKVSTYYSIAESIYHSIDDNSDCFKTDVIGSESLQDCHGYRLGQLGDNAFPSLLDPLPDTWYVEDGEFVMIHAVYQTHLGSDCYFSPHSKLNDGIIYLVMIRNGISRSQLFNFLINMSSGTHLPNKNTDFIRVEKVVAFRLEPHDNNGILTVDGERIECETFQAKMLPGTVNVMVPNNVAFKDF